MIKNNELPKTNFIFDPRKELEAMKVFVNEFNHDSFLPDKIKSLLANKNDKQIIRILEKSYREGHIQRLENSWKKIEKPYFELVEKITGHKWIHKKYNIVLTKYIFGFCNPFTPETNYVFVRQNTTGISKNYIIAHELFHSHYFKIIKNKNNDLWTTEYNENCAILALLFTEIKKLFPYFDEEVIQSCINSHPSAARHFKSLLIAWKSRENFDSYLEQSLKIVK